LARQRLVVKAYWHPDLLGTKEKAMREYEIEHEIFEGKGATITGPPYPDLAGGLCAWMLGDEGRPGY
jgi:hypothetical protein